MKTTARKLIVIPAIALTAGISLAACGSQPPVRPAPSDIGAGGSSTSAPAAAPTPAAAAAAAPGDATSTLTSDGYTTAITESPAQISTTFGDAAPYVTSAAAGTSGSSIEVVVYIDASEITTIGGPDAATTVLENDLPGTTVTTTPAGTSDVIRFTGPASAFTSS